MTPRARPTSCTPSSTPRSATRRAARRPRRVGRTPRPPRARALRESTLDVDRELIAAAAAGWPAGSRRAGGCSRSATAAAPPTPPRWRRCSRRPPWGEPLPACSLAADEAVLTALGNDVGFDLVFSRQLIAHAAGDMALAMSTSGNSENLLAGAPEALARGMLTVGFAGYDGGSSRCHAMWTFAPVRSRERPPDPGGAGLRRLCAAAAPRPA